MPRSSEEIENSFATRGGRREPGVGIMNDRVLDGRFMGDLLGPLAPLLGYPLAKAADAYEAEKQHALDNPKFRAAHNAVVGLFPNDVAGRFKIDETTSRADARNTPAFLRGIAGGDLYPPQPRTRVPGMTPHVTTDEGNFQLAPQTPARPQPVLPQPPIEPTRSASPVGNGDGVGDVELPPGMNSGYKFPVPQLVEPDVLPTKERIITVPSDGTNVQNTLKPPKPKVVGPGEVQHTNLTGSNLTPEENRIRNSNNFNIRDLFGGYYGGSGGSGGDGINSIGTAY